MVPRVVVCVRAAQWVWLTLTREAPPARSGPGADATFKVRGARGKRQAAPPTIASELSEAAHDQGTPLPRAPSLRNALTAQVYINGKLTTELKLPNSDKQLVRPTTFPLAHAPPPLIPP